MTGIEHAGRQFADEIQFSADLALVLFEHSPDAIVLVAEDGLIARGNRQAALLTMYPASELRGMLVDALLPESVRDNHPGHRARFLEDARVRPMGTGMDLRMRRRNGTEVPVDINLSPVMLVQGMFVIATIRRRTSG
jgi:protein-histidine pros-kinase